MVNLFYFLLFLFIWLSKLFHCLSIFLCSLYASLFFICHRIFILLFYILYFLIFYSMIYNLFSNHSIYYLSNLGLNYTGVFGFILFFLFVIQFLSGIILTLYYSSYYSISFYSIFYITFNVNYG